MTLFLPVGPPGSGKSYLANALVQQKILVPEAVVSTDSLRRIMTGSTTDQSVNDAAWMIARRICHERLERGLTVYFDATNLKYDWYDKMLDLAKQKDHRILFIYFDTPYRSCRSRNLDRKESAIPDVAVERMIEEHRSLDVESLKQYGDLIMGGVDSRMLLTGIQTWLDGETPE